MQAEIISRLQNWYKMNCNGDWEHSYGLNISNIDNPGWAITIDLNETPFDSAVFEKSFDNGELDWISIQVKDKKFIGNGDPNKLLVIIEIFLNEFLPNYGDGNFYYDIYEPISQNGSWYYKRLRGKLRTEDTFEIVHVPEFVYKELKADDFDKLDKLNFDDLKASAKLEIGKIVKCDLKHLADYPTVVIVG